MKRAGTNLFLSKKIEISKKINKKKKIKKKFKNGFFLEKNKFEIGRAHV